MEISVLSHVTVAIDFVAVLVEYVCLLHWEEVGQAVTLVAVKVFMDLHTV